MATDPLSDLPPGVDAYKTLQVDPEADPEVIQAAYRRLARKFHPDVASGLEAKERMILINASWEVLRDPERRRAYDRRRRHQSSSARGTAPPSADPNRAGQTDRTSGAGSTARPSSQAAGTTPGSTQAGSKWGPDAPLFRSGAGGDRPPDTVSSDWTTGRSTTGSGYDPSTMRSPDGPGAAGPPPGRPSGAVLNFGRYAGWSLGEVARMDVDYLEWLDRASIGRQYRDELDVLLRRLGRRRSTAAGGDGDKRRGLYRRP